eukprot:scaffold150850_cov26-Tisochrysis_lutea.AAC.2
MAMANHTFSARRRSLDGSEQEPELLMEMFERGTRLLISALPSVWDGSCKSVLTPQDDSRATKASAGSHDPLRQRASHPACGTSRLPEGLADARLCKSSPL